MHVMLMVGITTFVFLISLCLLCVFREKLNNPIINPLFVASAAILIFCWNYATFDYRGPKTGFITLENISPYICSVIAVSPLLNRKVKEYAYAAIAYLSFGMFLALLLSPEFEYLLNYQHESKFWHVSEAACHVIMGVYGYYLILSNKIKLNLKSFGKAVIFMYGSVGFGVFLNYFFHTSFFGMNMHGKYAIYFLDIFGSFEITLLAYLLGILATLALGFLTGSLLDRLSRPKKKHADSVNE